MSKTNSYSFIAVGKTQETSDSSEGYKRYVGLASSYVLAVNPDKKKLEEIFDREIAEEPNYIIEDERRGKGVLVDILVKTDPQTNNGVEIISHAQFRLFPVPCYDRDKTKQRIIDDYGNSVWMSVENVEANAKPLKADGKPAWIDTKYRKAFVGEADILDFLRKFLYKENPYEVVDGEFKIKSKAPTDLIIAFEDPKKLLSGDVSEVREAIALQPNNRIKLLYGVRTNAEGKPYQTVCTAYDLMLRNNATDKVIARLEKNLTNAKNSGLYSNIEYKVQELQKYDIKPTDLEDAPFPAPDSSEMPWD